MPIESNSFSLNANLILQNVQQNLSDRANSLAQTKERLSSGLRINSTSDDPGAQALAMSIYSDRRTTGVAVQNISDAISVVNVAQDALDAQKNVLSQMEEIATKASEYGYTTAQQTAATTEYNNLVEKLGKIGSDTRVSQSSSTDTFPLFARGTNQSSLSVQAGTDNAQSSQIVIPYADTATLSGNVDRDTFDTSGGVSGADANIASLSSTYKNQIMTFNVTDSSGTDRTVLAGLSISSNTVKFDFYIENGASATPPADASKWDYRSQSSVTYDTSSGAFNSQSLDATVSGFTGGATASISVDLRGLKMSSSTASNAPNLGAASAVELTGVETAGRASQALTVISNKQTQINSTIGQFEGSSDRLEHAMGVMSVTRENLGAAYGVITSVDVAQETANVVSEQIKKLASPDILHQAIKQSDRVLSLLQDDESSKDKNTGQVHPLQQEKPKTVVPAMKAHAKTQFEPKNSIASEFRGKLRVAL